jgi:exosortase
MEASLLQDGKISQARRSLWMSHLAWLALACLIFAPTIHWLWQRWTMSVWNNSHGLFVPFVVAYLVYDALRADPIGEEEASGWGFLFVIPGLTLVLVDAAIKTELLSALGLILCLPGFSLLLLGARRTKLLIFPWTLAPFMLPIPAAFVEPILLLLRRISAVGAAELLSLLGIPVLRDHTTLRMPNVEVAILDACSGFSTLYASITAAILFAYLATSTSRRLLVLALAAPFAIVCNILRCAALALMAHAWGIDVLSTYLHPLTGFIAFALTIFMLVIVADLVPFRRAVR